MKTGVFVSSAAHIAFLAWGLVSLSAPTPLQVSDVEALPIDIVPIEEFATAVQGDRDSQVTETPAPVPTQRPPVDPQAQNVGEADNDSKSEPEAKPAEIPVEAKQASAPPPAPIPTPSPEVEPEVQPEAENVPAPTTELAATNEPAVPVSEQPPAEELPVAEAGEQFAALDQVKAVPQRRPEPPKPNTAATTERKKPAEPAKTQSASTNTAKQESVTDDIASLLNKQEPASSGARRSTEQASLGTRTGRTSGELSQSEMDALKAQLATCWSIPAGAAGADELSASVEFELDQNAQLIGKPRVTKSSGNRQFDGSAVRAIQKCELQGFRLPSGKHDVWNQVQVNFDPRDMF